MLIPTSKLQSSDSPLSFSQPGGALSALRAATRERHRIVDRSMPLSIENPTHADYLAHVRLMRAWLAPLERGLEITQGLQTALIDADLAEANVEIGRERREVASRFPASAGAAYRWGVRYVIEGSRLGAAVLYGRLRHSLHPHKLHYLLGGEGTSQGRWPKFLRELGEAVQTPAGIAEACDGACDTFDALISLLRERA